ncbi:MAG: aldo/keto reductase [Anaerolineae bacterium]|nr:aldo/keto reductase [Anaerolineae bacterium]
MSDQHAQTSFFDNVTMGIGAWAWGDRLTWGYGRGYQLADLRAVFETSLAAGIRLFDTAEVYGQGQSETILGQFIKTTEQPVEIATKFMPFPWRLTRGTLLKALRGSLRRLGVSQVKLYQVHMPLPPMNIETWMEAMVEAVQAGLIQGVGVSNYDSDQMRRAYDRLMRDGIPLASNQVEYNLLNRKVEKNGLLKQCEELGIKVIAYSPLAMGVLSGKYSPDNLPGGVRGGRYNQRFVQKILPMLDLLKKIGNDHAGKTPAQVAINWTICKGTLPIPGAKTQSQADQNAGALNWRLSDEEVAWLDAMSDQVLQD